MELEQLFNSVLSGYNNGFKLATREDPNYKLLCNDLPDSLSSFINRNDIKVFGSIGNGQKNFYPWVALFKTSITRSATKGLYIVYLFKTDMSGFYLSLNQGITYYSNKYKRNKYKYCRKVADYFRSQIDDDYFSKEDIDLGKSSSLLGRGYQETNIVSKYYPANSFTTQELEDDLKHLFNLYDEISSILAEYKYDYDKAIEKILIDNSEYLESADEAIEKIEKSISNANDVDLVRKLIYVEPEVKHSTKYSKIRDNSLIRKTDYVEKASVDAKVGLLGEELAMIYEQERLNKEGRSDLAARVRCVSIVSDSFGYDIVSFKKFGDEYKEIYIEVKTTRNKIDTAFPVSKHEKEVSEEKKDQYCVFRIYDANNVEPKCYCVFGAITDHFELDPITYMAKLIKL